jgi:hypothetical protein
LVYPYLATIDAFDILFGDDLLRGPHFINSPSLEKNKPITKF